MFDTSDIGLLTLDAEGNIEDCNHGSEVLFRYESGEMIRQHVSLLLPPLAQVPLLLEGMPNSHFRYLCRVGCQFQGISKAGERFLCELFLTLLRSRNAPQLSLIIRPDISSGIRQWPHGNEKWPNLAVADVAH